DVGVRVQRVCLENVVVRFRRCKHYYRDALEVGIVLDLRQQFAIGGVVKIEVEQNQVGSHRIAVIPVPAQPGKNVRAPGHDVQVIGFGGPFHDGDVLIVLGQKQNFGGRGRGFGVHG